MTVYSDDRNFITMNREELFKWLNYRQQRAAEVDKRLLKSRGIKRKIQHERLRYER